MPGEEAIYDIKFTLKFVEMLILGSLYTMCVITVKWQLLQQATRSQSIWRRLEWLQVKDESSTSWYEQVYSVGFLLLQLIHILALSP